MSQIPTRFTNVVWREAATVYSPELAAKRLHAITNNPDTVRRVGAFGVHMIMRAASSHIISFLSRPYEAAGMPVIGTGWNSTVLERGSRAIKIDRASELMTSESRMARIDTLRRLIDANVDCHPEATVDSEVYEGTHPLTGQAVVIVEQPYVIGKDALVHPSLATRKQLKLFAEKSLDEMIPNGVAPDLVGAGNLLVGDEGTEGENVIRLVDTVALEDLDTPGASFPYSVRKLQELTRVR